MSRQSTKRRNPAATNKPNACVLCGATEQQKSQRDHRGNSVSSIEKVDGRYCDACRTGLLDGTYAAVGVAHEARAVRLGHAMYCHPDMKPALKSYSIMTSTGSVPLPPRMPTIAGELSFQTVLKHHKERNKLQAQDNDRRAAAAQWEAEQAAKLQPAKAA
jgi:hypothetical protein